MTKLSWFPLALLAALSCSPAIRSTSFVDREPRPAGQDVRVYSSTAPACPFEEVGLATATKRAFVSMDDMLMALRDRARQMGGDALLAVSESARVQGIPIGDVVVVESAPQLTGTVIRFTDSECRA